MDITRLEEFLLIAQEKSIKKAAEKGGTAPTTLSSRLSVLEKEAGTSLFIRSRAALELTEEGRRFYKQAEEIVSSYHRLTEQMRQVSSEEPHSLRIGIIGCEIPFHLGPYLDILNLRYPHISLHLVDETHFSFPESLLSGDVDLIMGPVMNHFHHDDIIRHTIAPPHSGIYLPAGHPLAKNDFLSLSELEDQTFILYPDSRSRGIREFQLKNLSAVLRNYKTYDSDTSPMFLNYLVPVGKGLLLTPFHTPRDAPKCVYLPVTDIPAPAPDSVLYLKNLQKKEIKSILGDFMKFVKENTPHEHGPAL